MGHRLGVVLLEQKKARGILRRLKKNENVREAKEELGEAISEITLKHQGSRTNPCVFYDVCAVMFVEEFIDQLEAIEKRFSFPSLILNFRVPKLMDRYSDRYYKGLSSIKGKWRNDVLRFFQRKNKKDLVMLCDFTC